jgi:8-oxo-dGTP pyrophosphatase MutT (NUDIX family)
MRSPPWAQSKSVTSTARLGTGMKKSLEIRSWTVNRSSTIIRDRWIDLRADDCTTPAGVRISPYYVLRYPDWAHSICLDQDNRVCVVKQYRHGALRVMMELPGGVVEAGEDPLMAAKRELLEETGIRATQWRACGSFSPNPATHTNRFHVFACRVQSIGAPRPDESEEIQSGFLTLAQIRAAIDSGEFGQLLHIGALCRALNQL